ncbi:hypothetical protein C84B14_10757 [Salinisphaera sp. C84B14]|uniref:hypothetical protein n=1 Tax=Salinisphaera sp. C84B14 TaxID=1304155 RepID=UPI0033411381
MVDRSRSRVAPLYVFIGAILLLLAAGVVHAQSAIVNTHKPFTLKVRYGANADPAGPATDGPRSRRIETTVAELDSGRIETRDAVLEYWMDATGDSGDIALSIDFTHAIAQGKMHSQTRLLMGTGEWKLVSGSSGSDGVTESVFVRVDRN